MEKKPKTYINIPSEDIELANVLRVIFQDFNGDTPAFFKHVQDSLNKVDESSTKEESGSIKKFAKSL